MLPPRPSFFCEGRVLPAADTLWAKRGVCFRRAVLPSDYDVWRLTFGQTAGSGSGATANAAIPEPTTLVLLIVAAAGVATVRRPIAWHVSKTHLA
jgi:hypothetical protein